MSEVIYSINNKYFKDFGVFVSSSEGLLDKLKPKNRKVYDWAEYHGKQVDLSAPRYEEREIVLKGWVEGDNWEEMNNQFHSLLSEFDKEGLTRLLVEFGGVLVYDVYLSDGVELEKTFRKGKVAGVFTLKVKEPNPVKKIIKAFSGNFTLSFTSSDWVEVNIDGESEMMKGVVNINKNLKDRLINSKSYPNRGVTEHYISISGNIETLEIQTNGEVI